MIFYGKASRRVAVDDALRAVEGWIAEALAGSAPRIERHAAWTSALVEAGGLAQGLADAGEAGDGAEAAAAAESGDRAMALCVALAGAMGRSWTSGFAELPRAAPPAVADALAALRLSLRPTHDASPDRPRAVHPRAVEVRRTEGFSHYALYPEGHWAAAAGLAAPRPARVLGLRSIGATLAAAAAAALGAPPPRTARPRGHPFAREVAISPPLEAAERGAVWAVVDEGPGLSGSSMGAAAEALARSGVAAEDVLLLPGHAGPPGAMASDAHRRLWAAARVAVTPFEDLIGGECGAAAGGLGAWVADIAGASLAPPEDVAGGGWRRHLFAGEAEWPAVDRQNERRKYLLRGERRTVLLRFAGLADFGREKLDRARALHAAGFGVEPLALRHGFLVEPWRADLRPADLRPAERGGVERAALLRRIADYLAFRARRFPAAAGDGAALPDLLEMARVNAAELLGAAAAARLDGWAARLPALALKARPVAIDGCLAPHEWLVAPPGDAGTGGTLLKADALDGCCGHDLVGCQDVAWDVAGAAVEWGLSGAETEALRAAVAARGPTCDPGLVAFFSAAYPAFRGGALAMAAAREGGSEAVGGEAARLAAALGRQVEALRRALG